MDNKLKDLSLSDLHFLKNLSQHKLDNLGASDPEDTQDYYSEILYATTMEIKERIESIFPRTAVKA